MEGGTFLEDQVQDGFQRFVEIRLHGDHGDPEIRARNKSLQQRMFGSVALPYYALLSPDGQTVYWRKGGVIDGDDFADYLKKAP